MSNISIDDLRKLVNKYDRRFINATDEKLLEMWNSLTYETQEKRLLLLEKLK